MSINERKLQDKKIRLPNGEIKIIPGKIRYEARLSEKGPGWTHRFWTREEAEVKLAAMKKQVKRKEYQGRIVNQHDYNVDIKGLWDFFLLGVVK